ncbi:hypothetical protein BJV74DRAFT_797200 [Russula compacta]|nr:hypothetical protein BJV74DRAFT_797200 [Russula compacta]
MAFDHKAVLPVPLWIHLTPFDDALAKDQEVKCRDELVVDLKGAPYYCASQGKESINFRHVQPSMVPHRLQLNLFVDQDDEGQDNLTNSYQSQRASLDSLVRTAVASAPWSPDTGLTPSTLTPARPLPKRTSAVRRSVSIHIAVSPPHVVTHGYSRCSITLRSSATERSPHVACITRLARSSWSLRLTRSILPRTLHWHMSSGLFGHPNTARDSQSLSVYLQLPVCVTVLLSRFGRYAWQVAGRAPFLDTWSDPLLRRLTASIPPITTEDLVTLD